MALPENSGHDDALLATPKPARMSLLQLMVSTSGLDPDKRRAVQSHASALGLVVEPDLTAACTHLVADTVLSDKYLVAVQMRIPVVSAEWMEASACHGEPLDEEDYLLRPLHRLVVCLSGPTFAPDDRKCIEALIQREGGRYTRTLERECTHLVADAASGEKYLRCCSDPQLAHVRLVSPAWLASSLSRGECADSNAFKLPSSSSSASSLRAPAQLDCSFGTRIAQRVPELYLDRCILYIPGAPCLFGFPVCPCERRWEGRRHGPWRDGDADTARSPRKILVQTRGAHCTRDV